MSSIVAAITITAAAAGYSAYRQKRAGDKAEDRFKRQEADAAKQVQEAKQADRIAERTAKNKAKKREADLQRSGRPSTFNTSMFGLTDAAPIKKKVLG